MYFVRYQPLKDKLRDRTLSEREALPYLVVFVALASLAQAFPKLHEYGKLDAVSGLLNLGAAIWGILYSYHHNGGRAGHDLIRKFVVLGWIVSVRCILAFIPISLLLIFLGATTGMMSWESYGWYDVSVIFLINILVYQRIGRHIRDTRDKISEPPPSGDGVPGGHPAPEA